MNRRRTSSGLATLALVAGLAFVGCGEVQSSSGAGGTEVTADTGLAARVPAEVARDGVLLVATDATYAPSEFLDTDNRTVIGFEVDLFGAVAAKLGLEARFQNAKFDAIIPGVMSGKYEIGVSSFTINDERKQQVHMVSYFAAGTQWFTRKGNPEAVHPDDACGMSIAVQNNTIQVEDLQARSRQCTEAGKPAITIDQYQDQGQATAAIAVGKEAAGLADSPVGAYAVKQTGDKLELLGEIYDSAPYGAVVPKAETAFADALASAIQAVIDEGTYRTVLSEWGVEQGAIPRSEVNPDVP